MVLVAGGPWPWVMGSTYGCLRKLWASIPHSSITLAPLCDLPFLLRLCKQGVINLHGVGVWIK